MREEGRKGGKEGGARNRRGRSREGWERRRQGGREVRGRGRGGRGLVYNVSGYVCTGNNLSFTNVALFTL